MIEVEATLRFDQHSLGNCRHKKINRMLHAPDGRVMFLPTWWQSLMRYAAKVANKHYADAQEVDWDPIIEGTPREYKRFYAPSRYSTHEAFFPGDEIVVRAVVPSTLSIDDFSNLLRIAGRYRGISPYRKDKQYGTFEVVEVRLRTQRAGGN